MIPHDLRARADRFLFAPVRSDWAAVLRVALAIAIPVFFWPSHGSPMPIVRSLPGTAALYEAVLLTPYYWALILGVAALFGLGWRVRWTGGLLLVLLLPLSLVVGARASRQVMMFTLLALWILPRAGPMWPIRLIQLQLTVVYGVNALAKATPEYLSGEILLGMSHSLPNFLDSFPSGVFQRGPLSLTLAQAATASVATEAFLAVGFWFRRLRWVAAGVGVVFHAMLWSVVDIHLFDWASMFLYLAFLLPLEGRKWNDSATF